MPTDGERAPQVSSSLRVRAARAARTARRVGLAMALAMACVGSVAALSGCGEATPPSEDEALEARAELRGDSELVSHFRDAERETGVPAALLATIAWMQTRLTTHPPAAEPADEIEDEHPHHPPPEWGVMGIGSARLTTLEEAARAVGASTHDVARDPRTNVLAAAHLLAARRAELGADWSSAVEAYAGPDLARVTTRLLRDGWRAVDDDGKAIEVVGHAVPSPDPGGERVGFARQALGYPGAIWNPAYGGNYTNASRGAAQIKYVVVHTVQGSYSGCISWFKNPSANVSAHYVVRSSDGEVTQMVDDRDVAHHDGCFNSHSIGIEHEGYVAEPGKWYTDAMYASSAKLTAWLCDAYGIPKDRAHIMGHGETPDCSSHTDPGSGWDWQKYMALVATGGAPPAFAGESLGVEGQSFPVASKGAVTVEVGQTVKGWVKLRNKGKETWKPGVVKLAPIPRDEPSPYAGPSWLSPTRISTVAGDVPPGAVGEFPLDLTGTAVGEGTLKLGWVAESATWFSDAPKGGGPEDGYFQVRVNVVPSTAPPPEPSGSTGGESSGDAASSSGAASGGSPDTSGAGGLDAPGAGGGDPFESGEGGGASAPPNAALEGHACAAARGKPGAPPLWLVAAGAAVGAAARRRRRRADLGGA